MRWVSNLSLGAKLRVIVVYAAAVAVLIASVLHMSGEAIDHAPQPRASTC